VKLMSEYCRVRICRVCFPVIALVIILAATWPAVFFHYAQAASSTPDRNGKKILILNSYQRGLSWTDDIDSGIADVLQRYSDNLDISYEYMDAKKYSGEQYLDKLFKLYSAKYSSSQFDAVITSDDDAFYFVQKHRKTLFAGVPVVFCGLNYLEPASIVEPDLTTGLMETINLVPTIDIMVKLQPDLRKIVAIHDGTTSGMSNKLLLSRIVPKYPSLEFVFFEMSEMGALLENVGKLGRDSAVIFLGANRDAAGVNYSFERSCRLISKNSSVPVYGLWSFFLDNGIVGGKLIDGKTQGKIAANLVARIFSGEKPSSIPIIAEGPGAYMFDYSVMKKFGLDVGKLPSGSVIINYPNSSYSVGAGTVWTAIFLSAFMFLAIALLLVNIWRRKTAERELTEAKGKLEVALEQIEEAFREKSIDLNNARSMLDREKAEFIKMRDELFESESRYKTIAENAYDIICETSIEGRYLFISRNIEDILGFKPSELLGDMYHNYIHPEDVENAKEAFVRVLEGRVMIGEVTIRHKNSKGDYIWLESTGKLIRSTEGAPVAVVLVSRDITVRKRLEEEMLKTSKLESVGILAGGIAHDFNNILMTIVGNLNLAKRKIKQDDKVHDLLTRAEKVAHRAKTLTDQLITFSKGGYPVKKMIDMGELLRESVQFVLIGSSIVCRFFISEKAPMVEVDDGQISQVITNLVINAKQAMSDDGSIEITVDHVEIGHRDGVAISPGNYVRVQFRDHGTGIPAEIIDKIFDPFFTTKPEGSGLGLSTSYSIMKKHGGIITVESTPGAGSIFYLYFPAAPVAS